MAMNTNTANIYIKATDNTKQAFESISGKLKTLAATATAATAGIILIAKAFQTVSQSVSASFDKFSGLNDIADNFDVSLEKALGFTDAMNVVGMSAEETTKTFSELSTNITKAFTDEKLRLTFNQLGITLKDLKNGNVADIFEKILNSTANTADKAKQLTLLKDVFGKQGLKILDASQDDRVKNILANAERMKDVIRATAFVTDEFSNSLNVAGNKIQNEIAMGFAPILPSITAFVESLFSVNDELDKSSKLLSFIDNANTFKLLIDGAFEFADVVTASFVKLGEIVGGLISLLGGSLLKLIPSINLVGDAIFGGIVGAIKGAIGSLGDLSSALIKVIKGDFEGAKIDVSKAFDLSTGWKRYKDQIKKNQLQIDFSETIIDESWKTVTGKLKLGRFDKEKASFNKAFRDQIKGIASAVSKDQDNTNRTGVKVPVKVNLLAQTDKFLKDIESQLNIGKDNIDFLMRYNEAMYSSNLKDIEEYYQNKKDLMITNFEFQKSLMDEEIKLLNENIPKADKQEDKYKLQEKLNDLLVKRNKLENDNIINKIELDSKSSKDIFDNKVKELNFISQIRDMEIESLREQGVEQGFIFENNLKIKGIKEEQIRLLEEENKLILEQKQLSKEDTIKLLDNQKKISVLKKNTDEIAVSLNKSINGAFETMFSNVLTGTKSLKEAFLDMANTINQEIMKIISQQLTQKLMGNILPSGSSGSGGIGGFVSNLFSGIDISGFFATGGYAQAGNAYVVGEKGPELFFPQQSGYVANNRDSSNMSGGGNNIVINIQTQDIESFRNSEARIASQIQKAIIRGNRVN